MSRMDSAPKAAERKVIIELTDLLRKNEEKVLSGETNLCLTTSSLGILANNFRRYSENQTDDKEGQEQKQDVNKRKWQENIRILFDFVIKVKALKIIHSSQTMRGPIQINRFRSLQVLELKKVPIHMVEGLSKLRLQLREITVSKSIQTLKDLLETCGGDRTPGLVWSNLKKAFLSFNMLVALDDSLHCIPFVEVVDLSHNSITKTGDFLLSLADVMRINLGFNMLKRVPQFPSRNNLRTLIVRNNNLEHLEGVEELTSLQELDAAENFLLDHKVLGVLSELKSLQVLCVIGNPMSYKVNHRQLTLQYISPHAGLGIFLLDGRRLTNEEVIILQQNQFKRMVCQTEVIIVPDSQDTTDSGPSRTPSQLSPAAGRKKKGHRRVLSKERVPTISDIEESLMQETAAVTESLGPTPTSSYREDSDLDVQRQQDEEYFKTLREHYKDDWLKALTANQKPAKDSFESLLTDQKGKLHSPQSEHKDGEIATHVPKKDTKKSTDTIDGAVKDKVPRTDDKKDSTPKKKPETKLEPAQPVVEDQILPEVCKPVTSPTSPDGLIIKETTDIYSLSKPKKAVEKLNKEERLRGFYSQESVESPTRTDVDSSEQYGEESEPFILMLPDDDMKLLFVTLNQRFITEKDFEGKRLGSLDLKCLLSVRKTEEKCYGRDIIGGFIFTILTLNFDYIKKELRQRRYAMESDQDALKLEELLKPHLRQEAEDKMQCLKCQHEFYMPPAKHSDIIKCPSCSSKMVIKAEKPPEESAASTLTQSLKVTDTSSDSDMEKQFANQSKLRRSSSTRRSFRHRPSSWRESANLGLDEPDSIDTPSAVADSLDEGVGKMKIVYGESLKDYVDRLIPDEEPKDDESEDASLSKEKLFTSSLNETPTSQRSVNTTAMKSNSSWSDVRKSSTSSSGARQSITSVASVESDITVLASDSSRGSIAVMSDSSKDTQTSSAYSGQITSASEVLIGSSHVTSGGQVTSDGHMVTINGVDWRRNSQGGITPVGSPLTNSICSSMVSSVYENTLAGSGEEKASDDIENSLHEEVERLSNTDDEIAEQVPVRRSKGRSKKKRSHREVTVYDNSSVSSQNKSRDSSHSRGDTSDSECIKSGKKKASIYDTSDGALKDTSDSNISKDQPTESNIPSIYDTTGSSEVLESTSNDSAGFLNHSYNRSGDHSLSQNSSRSHDQLSANQDDSSPLRRTDRSSSRGSSRSSSKHRSALCYGDSIYDTSDNSQSESVPEFPSDLSPIKRSRSSRKDNRHAVMMESEDDISVSSEKHSESSDAVYKRINETNESLASAKSSEASSVLPWEQDVRQSMKSKRDESLNHEEFVNIDHNIKLHLELHVFKAEETAQCAIQCSIVQYMKKEEIKSILVISCDRIMIFREEGESTSPDWLKCYEDQPITELQYIDIGLGYQTLRLEFDTVCSSYTLLIGDESRCKKFLTLISDIVQRGALSDDSRLEGIVKSNPATYKNLEEQVLTVEGEDEPQQLIRFLMVKFLPGDSDGDFSEVTSFMSLVVTATDLVLVQENHQWPLPRLQAPLPEELKGRQFTVLKREKINNIETLFYNEYNPMELRLTFFEATDTDQSAAAWMIAFITVKGVKSFVDAIREPWEKEFGVSLDILSTSFTDTETSGNV